MDLRVGIVGGWEWGHQEGWVGVTDLLEKEVEAVTGGL